MMPTVEFKAKNNHGVRYGRWSIPLLLASVSIFLSTDAWAIDVTNQADWNTAVAAVAAAGPNSTVTINLTSGFTLSSSLAAIEATNSNVTVNITGNNQAINGASTYQGIQISGANAPTVNISGLAITNTAAIGGAGENGQNGYYSGNLAYGSGGGGGGGLGAGGGLFVGSGANVTLSAVTFTGTTATGGTGGNGGSAQNTAPSVVNGGNGGAGGAANNGGVSGGGGAGGTGGNTGTQGTAGSTGSALGDGGGGGGGSGTTNSNTYTINNSGGAGNANGGNGGSGGDGATNSAGAGGPGPGSDGGAGGNGGAANGGAIYVATGATLTILDSAISGASVAGGTAGTPGIGLGPSAINGFSAAAGAAQGSGIFLSGVQANIGVTTGTVTYLNTIAGTGLVSGGVNTALNKTGAGSLSLTGVNTFTGNINISGGTLSVGATNNLGNIANDIVMSDGTTFAVTGNTTFASGRQFNIVGESTFDIASSTTSTIQGVLSDNVSAGNLIKAGDGTLLLSGANTYSGTTSVNGGTLMAGSANAFGSSNSFSVASGTTLDLNGFNQTFAALSGAGTVTGATSTISGTFSPGDGTAGSSMTVNGNLAFQQGAQFNVLVSPDAASSVNVTGTATLNGATVNASYANGGYVAKRYAIVTASNGLGGSTFSGIANTNLPSGFTPTLTYDTNNAYLNLDLTFNTPSGLNDNQQNVADALTNYFDTNGGIPAVFGALTPNGLTQLSGELGASSGAESVFNSTNYFLETLLAGHSYGGAAGSNRSGARLAAAQIGAVKVEPTADAPPAAAGWSMWGSAFGGTADLSGNDVKGSHDTDTNAYGLAVGWDYAVSDDTLLGLAVAGGRSNWDVNDGLGSGNSNFAQLGLYGTQQIGQIYVSAAGSYAWHGMSTDRNLNIAGDSGKLTADFNASNIAGRLEGGYRIGAQQSFGVTPYGALQGQATYLPGYNEDADHGAGDFALSYNANTATTLRSELGVWLDTPLGASMGASRVYGRLAWAHDWNSNPSVNATFQSLDGANFTVYGAGAPADLALVSLGTDMAVTDSANVTVSFDGEFAQDYASYAGSLKLGFNF